ncbi:hypothetical protein FCIRC_11915 [Fusarium circinatum]|uniref:Uncharacterized protein n=1 Tax=Fusarium circinatum TaxID=48490 RepID=A0A8H5SY91_FUSCI|nr:hypothetical protein FCIRC_11915 [Fusarium circinatum]
METHWECELSSKDIGFDSLTAYKHAQLFADLNIKYLHRSERDGEGPGSSETMPPVIDSGGESNVASDDNAARTSGSGNTNTFTPINKSKPTEDACVYKVRACLDFQQITDKDASAGTVTATSGCAGTINPPEVNATISGPGNADTPSAAVSEGSGDDSNGNEPIEVFNAVNAVVDRLMSSGQNRAPMHPESATE